MYQKIEEPVLPKFGYYLPDEFGNKWFGAEYVSGTKKWYIPSDAVPAFVMSIYAGQLQSNFSTLLPRHSALVISKTFSVDWHMDAVNTWDPGVGAPRIGTPCLPM